MKLKPIHAFSLAFVFLVVGISNLAPTLGNAYQLEFEIWGEKREIWAVSSWQTASTGRTQLNDSKMIIHPYVSYELFPDTNISLWFDGGDVKLRINNVDHTYISGVMNNFTYDVTRSYEHNYYSFLLHAVTEPRPIYLPWLIWSGIFACLPLLVFIGKAARDWWEKPLVNEEPAKDKRS